MNALPSVALSPVIVGDNALSFQDAVRQRRSCRGFLPVPVPIETIRSVLEDAQLSPSNCNTQPWHTHVVSGGKREELIVALLDANARGHFTPDFSFDMDAYHGVYGDRKNSLGAAYYGALGVTRDDVAGRADAGAQNYHFFGAPHVALLFMPSFGDNVRTAADVGMYGQTFLLSLSARGLAGVPQTSLGFFAETIREVLGIPSELKMLFGISFGHRDEGAAANQVSMDRSDLGESVTFHG